MDALEKTNCPDCSVEPGLRHDPRCDVARCPECGQQYIFHDCANFTDTTPPTIWTGIWPGVAEATEFGWFTDANSIWGEVADLNRLYASGEAKWDKTLQRWVLVDEQ